jgi:hypothetical protein
VIQDPIDPQEAMTDDGRMMAKVFFQPLDGDPATILRSGTFLGWTDPDDIRWHEEEP